MKDFLTELFKHFNETGIRFLVLRNYETLPEATTNDIDLLMDSAQTRRVETALWEVTQKTGWRIHNRAEFSCLSYFLHHPETQEQLHLDFMFGIHWHSLLYGDGNGILERRIPYKDFFIPAPPDEAMISLMTRLVYGGYVKESYREKICNIAQHSPDALRLALAPWVGATLSRQLVRAAQEQAWENIARMTQRLRRRVLMANLRHPICLGRRIISDGMRLIQRWMVPPGVLLVLTRKGDTDRNVCDTLWNRMGIATADDLCHGTSVVNPFHRPYLEMAIMVFCWNTVDCNNHGANGRCAANM